MKRLLKRLEAYFALTKPTIMLLVVITGAAGLALEGGLNDDPLRFALALFLLALAGGSANGLNQYFERERDALMERTRRRRPLPMKLITPAEALAASTLFGVLSVTGFAMWFNLLSAFFAAVTILFYAIFYTLYLKPRTSWNIVIGGAAGAMGPVITWAAAGGGTSVEAWVMFGIIFFWTPPHFWALALGLKEDYRKAGLPMLPILVSDDETWRRIRRYTYWTVAASGLLMASEAGWIYAACAALLGVWFLTGVRRGSDAPTPKAAWRVFGWSIIYLLALFSALIIDRTAAYF